MLYIDLFKHVLHKEKLIKKEVQVHHKNGNITTRLQWVDPHTGKPENSTFNHHDQDHPSVRIFNTNDHVHKIVHMPINNVKTSDEIKINQYMVDRYKKTMLQGKKLPPVVLDGHKNITQGHHMVQAARELGLSHVPSIVHSDDPEISKIIENVHLGLDNARPIAGEVSDKSTRELTFRELSDKIKGKGTLGVDSFKQDGYVKLQREISKHWDILKPYIEESIKTDASSSNLSKERQLHVLGYCDKHPRYSWLHNKDLCKAVNETIFDKETLGIIRNKLESSTLSINMVGDPSKILQEGYKSSNLKSYLGEDEYNKFIDGLGEDSKPENVLNALEMEYGHDVADRNVVEYDLMGAHPLDHDNRPVYMAYNPFNSFRGGAPAFGDPAYSDGYSEEGSVITVDPSVLSDCTLTTEDSFLHNDSNNSFWSPAMPVAKPMDMEHLAEIWINTHASQIQNSLDSSKLKTHPGGVNWTNFYDYWDEVHNQDGIQLELQYHNGSHLPPKLLKEWEDDEHNGKGSISF